MANTPPEPKPDKRVSSRRSAEDKAVAALQARIAAYFRGVVSTPSREDYIKTVLGGFPDGLIKRNLGIVTSGATHPSVAVSIDPLFDVLTAHAAKQWHDHVSPPTVSAAPKAS